MTGLYLDHITKDGERWDQLAWRYYGDPHGYERIVAANPDVPIAPVLAGGTCLRIPVIDKSVPTMEGLPPWKR